MWSGPRGRPTSFNTSGTPSRVAVASGSSTRQSTRGPSTITCVRNMPWSSGIAMTRTVSGALDRRRARGRIVIMKSNDARARKFGREVSSHISEGRERGSDLLVAFADGDVDERRLAVGAIAEHVEHGHDQQG